MSCFCSSSKEKRAGQYDAEGGRRRAEEEKKEREMERKGQKGRERTMKNMS